MEERKRLIPEEAIPFEEAEVRQIDGEPVLFSSEAMFTFYRRARGEFTRYFLGLRDEFAIWGRRCQGCGVVRVPPFMEYCPECDFQPMEWVEVGDTGALLHTPPVTYFPTSLFYHAFPYGRGRCQLRGADTALSVTIYSTQGIIRPGYLRRGMELKVVFRKERIGLASDIFTVPCQELTEEQIRKKGLLETELVWEQAAPEVPEGTDEERQAFQQSLKSIEAMVGQINAVERARQDLKDWDRVIQVRTPGGCCVIRIQDGALHVAPGENPRPNFTMTGNIEEIERGLGYQGSLTHAIISGRLWISVNQEFVTVFKMERAARSLARSKNSRG